MNKILIGNSFPLSLVRKKVVIEPTEIDLAGKEVYSFWGHQNSIKAASDYVEHDLTPKTTRPEISLNQAGLPELHGITFTECCIISPNYTQNFRPEIGTEVTSNQIKSWTTLKITWEK